MSSRTSCARVSRLSICPAHWSQTHCSVKMIIGRRVLTSDSREAAGTACGVGMSRIRVYSKPSFSFSKRRRSWMERSRTASRDMVMMGGTGLRASATVIGERLNRRPPPSLNLRRNPAYLSAGGQRYYPRPGERKSGSIVHPMGFQPGGDLNSSCDSRPRIAGRIPPSVLDYP